MYSKRNLKFCLEGLCRPVLRLLTIREHSLFGSKCHVVRDWNLIYDSIVFKRNNSISYSQLCYNTRYVYIFLTVNVNVSVEYPCHMVSTLRTCVLYITCPVCMCQLSSSVHTYTIRPDSL